MWYKNVSTTFFRFIANHAFDRQTDRQTDGQTEFSSLDRICIPCSAVEMQVRFPMTARHFASLNLYFSWC